MEIKFQLRCGGGGGLRGRCACTAHVVFVDETRHGKVCLKENYNCRGGG